ncbi:MAG: RdgB/HAM1 family non-canonical purine NTP pyrophosphatase [Eubacterium sp.]
MKEQIIFATTNQGKLGEIRMIMKDFDVDIISSGDAGINIDIEETGTTFEENALIKATTVMKLTGKLVLADDSGLEVDYLDKAPGIYSSRFLGEDTDYSIKNKYIIDKLKNAKGDERSARFVCAVAAAFPNGETIVCKETLEGQIWTREEGGNGFGFDPIFFVPEYGMTTGQMTPEQKNLISHRGKALRAMKEELYKKLK